MSAQVVGAQTTFDAWVASKGDAVGPPGTTSVLTPLAARELWDREAQGADVLDDALPSWAPPRTWFADNATGGPRRPADLKRSKKWRAYHRGGSSSS